MRTQDIALIVLVTPQYVSIELDDPFGTDPNDFNCLRMTYVSDANRLVLLLKKSYFSDNFLTHSRNSLPFP